MGPAITHRPRARHTAHWDRLLLSDVFDQATVSRLSVGYHVTGFHADGGDHAPQKGERDSGLMPSRPRLTVSGTLMGLDPRKRCEAPLHRQTDDAGC